jgi:hypothetical protein
MRHIHARDDISGTLRIECAAEDPSLCLYIDGSTSAACSGDPHAVHELARLYTRNRYDFVMTFADYLKGEGLVARKAPVPRHIRYHLDIAAGRN